MEKIINKIKPKIDDDVVVVPDKSLSRVDLNNVSGHDAFKYETLL